MSTRTGRRARTATVVAVASVLGIIAVAGAPPSPSATADDPRVNALPPMVKPAFTPGAPRRLGSTRHLSHWASVRVSVPVRAAPRSTASRVATLRRDTPEGTRNLVAVIERKRGRNRQRWVHVRLPVLPNGSTGWVPRSALGGYETVDTRLDIDLRRLTAALYRDGQRVLEAAIGVGKPGWETPRGLFYIRNKLTRYRSKMYGPVAFGTSARSPSATDWPAGGFIGIHGTDRPDLVPGAVSHGCIRMSNADILALARLMPIGTPVAVH
jgi:lipoprotein-anchoring transpeptidase ErfK/SrfK